MHIVLTLETNDLSEKDALLLRQIANLSGSPLEAIPEEKPKTSTRRIKAEPAPPTGTTVIETPPAGEKAPPSSQSGNSKKPSLEELQATFKPKLATHRAELRQLLDTYGEEGKGLGDLWQSATDEQIIEFYEKVKAL